jgi:hypothetical protein
MDGDGAVRGAQIPGSPEIAGLPWRSALAIKPWVMLKRAEDETRRAEVQDPNSAPRELRKARPLMIFARTKSGD